MSDIIRRRPVKLDLEKNIAICCIMSQGFLHKMSKVYKAELFKSEYIALIIAWCIEHHEKHGTAPSKNIKRIYERKKDTLEEEVIALIESVLVELSGNYEKYETIDNGFEFEEAERYLSTYKIEQHTSKVQEFLLNGELDKAKKLTESYSPIPNIEGELDTLEVFSHKTAVLDAFKGSGSPLFFFEGAFGKMFNRFFTKSGLIAIMGAEKMGKTWATIAMLLKALQAQRRVAYFAVGDMPQDEMLIRIAVALSGRSNEQEFCTGVRDVVSAEYADDEIAVEFSAPYNVQPLTPHEAQQTITNYGQQVGSNLFRLVCSPTHSVTASELKAIASEWRKADGWQPEVIIIDYPDILLPEKYEKERRHFENSKWMEIRGWSTDKEHNQPLIIIPTQIKQEGYKKKYITREEVAEDKRKLAHPTVIMGLNQSEEEKDMQVMRFNLVAVREGRCSPAKCCTATQCLDKGQFIAQSFWRSTDENTRAFNRDI